MRDRFTEERTLVKGLQKSDTDAFEELYRLYSLRLYHFGLKHLKSEVEAEGLVQDVFAKIWENRKTLRPDLSFKSYIFMITFNFIRKHFNKTAQFHAYVQDREGKMVLDSQGSSDEAEYHSLLEYLKILVDKLPERTRSIFIKSRIEGLAVHEIAEEMHIAPKTVRNQLTAAIKFIKANWVDISTAPYL